MSMVINIKNEIGGFSFAGSRDGGERIREKIKPVLDQNDSVTLDFIGIDGVTQSFVDEVIGIFIRAFGLDYIRGKLMLNNANEEVRTIFNLVVSYSIKRCA